MVLTKVCISMYFFVHVTCRYLMNHLNNLFAGAFESRDMSPIPVNQQKATPSQGQAIYTTLTIKLES